MSTLDEANEDISLKRLSKQLDCYTCDDNKNIIKKIFYDRIVI